MTSTLLRTALVALVVGWFGVSLAPIPALADEPPETTTGDEGIAPDADESNFDPANIYANPAQPGVGFCLLNFFCELDPTKNAVESYGYKIFRFVTSFLGIIFIAILIYGGFLSLTSFGNEAAAKKGHEAILAAVVGFIVLLLAYAAVRTFVDFTKS